MNKVKHNKILLLAFVLALTPALAFAQSSLGGTAAASTATGPAPSTSSIFTCNQQGAYALSGSVGSTAATGGVYVPVSDATVELNTGTLVYEECVLRAVVDATRMAATAGIIQTGTNYILTGRNGAAQFVQQQGQAVTAVQAAAVQAYLQNNPNIPPQIANAIAQGYATTVYNAPSILTCPYAGATTAFTTPGSQFSWNNILAIGSPCNPLFGYIDANDLVMGAAAQEVQCQENQWQWGGGFYAVTTGSGGPCEQQIVTPSSQVNGLYSQLLQSPFNQLQSANDIGQMVGATFSGISTQVLSGVGGGISGLTQPIGNGPSYLQDAVQEEAQNYQSSVATAGNASIGGAYQTEESYYSIMNEIAGTLTTAISQLRSSENQCWQNVTQALCPSGTQSNGDCTDINGVQVQVATSTEFSQPVINSQITALASTTATNIQDSQAMLSELNTLNQEVSSGSASEQTNAINAFDQLMSSNELHTQADITEAQSQEQSVQSTIPAMVQNTASLWAGTDPTNTSNNNIPWNGTIGATIQSTDPGVGWCNYQNKTTLQEWESMWKI
jgi:hypothetical protein